MEEKIKTKVYELLSPIVPGLRDNPLKEVTKSYVLYGITNGYANSYKTGCEQEVTFLTFNIFSVYEGEKEVIEIKEKITSALKGLYDLGEISYFALSSFNIISEEKPVKKHGVLTFRILSTVNNK